MNKRGQMEFSNFAFLLIFVVSTFVGGILAGVIYYDMETIDGVLHTVNFDLPIGVNATSGIAQNVTDFQDILGITIYPLLGLRSALPYLTYFMIFALIIAMGMVAYLGSKNPVFFVVHLLFTLLISYFCIILANTYVTLLQNPFINQMMIQFTIYNKLMLYLPQIVFFTGLLFGIIAFINLIKPQSNNINNQTSLNYGGDY